jgi:hypothetical protein
MVNYKDNKERKIIVCDIELDSLQDDENERYFHMSMYIFARRRNKDLIEELIRTM